MYIVTIKTNHIELNPLKNMTLPASIDHKDWWLRCLNVKNNQ
jgi:hypothetical protein